VRSVAVREVTVGRSAGELFATCLVYRVGKVRTVKYLILIYSNPASRKIWEGLSDEQRAEGFRRYAALNDDLVATGEMIVSEALADPSLARRVSVRDGRTMATDGPFAEAKEQLAGFFLVECESIERAVEHAARVPEAEHIEVEVRPVLDLSAFEL
jgi:hypothetical protein